MQSLKDKRFKNFEEKKLNEAIQAKGGYGGSGSTTRFEGTENWGSYRLDAWPDKGAVGKGYAPSL